MPNIKINHIEVIPPDILIMSTGQGIVFTKEQIEKNVLPNVVFIKTKIISMSGANVQILAQGRNSCYLINLDTSTLESSATFLFSNTSRLTSSLLHANNVYYGLEAKESTLALGRHGINSNINQNIPINTDIFESIIEIFLSNNKLILITKHKVIEFDISTNIITNQLIFNDLITSAAFDGNNFYIGFNNGIIKSLDLNLNETNSVTLTDNHIRQIYIDSTRLLVSTTLGLSEITIADFSVVQLSSEDTFGSTVLNNEIIVNLFNKVFNLTHSQDVYSFAFNRNLIPNLNQGFYQSRPVPISTNNTTAAFSWDQTGPSNNFLVTLEVNQTTDFVNFSNFSDPSSSNKGIFVPNVTPLTQAVGFRLNVDLADQRLPSPVLSDFKLTTSQRSLEPTEPILLEKAETLVTHTSYPQKFFDKSQIIRRHDRTFRKDEILNNQNISQFKESPYGFNYEFKSKVRDRFGRYSKESYNPLQLDFTKKSYPLSATPVKNIDFTVLNPAEIFISWDAVTELVDGTPIGNNAQVTYKILRKDDSNSIYRTIYADNLISLNADYITSIPSINNDFKQLTDGIIGPTHDEEESTLIFNEEVELTFSFGTVYTFDKIVLSFIKDFAPSRISLKIINGETTSDLLSFPETVILQGTVYNDETSLTVKGTGTAFLQDLKEGDLILTEDGARRVVTIESNEELTVDFPITLTDSFIQKSETINFSLDQENIQELTISNIGLSGDKLSIVLTPNEEKEIIKITETEVYKGNSSSEIRTFYRDLDVNFLEGSQYFYLIQAQLNNLVTPTSFFKETQTIRVGSNIILGLTDASASVYRLSLNNIDKIDTIVEQSALPIRLINLSSVLAGNNIITLGGRFDNSASNIASNLTFLSEINGQILTRIVGSNHGPFEIITGVNDTLKLSVDQKSELTIIFTPGTYSSEQIAFTINQYFNNSSDYGIEYNEMASVFGDQLILARPKENLFDRILIGDGNANSLLGFSNKNLGMFRPRIDLRSNRAYHTSWLIDDKVYIFGGLFDTINELPTNEVLKAKIDDNFLRVSLFDSVDLLPVNLYGHSLSSKDNYVYNICGSTDGGVFTDKVYLNSYDEITGSLTGWVPVSSPPVPTSFHTSQIVNDHIYMIGGKQFVDGEFVITKDIYKATIDSNYRLSAWAKIGELPKQLYLSTSAVVGSKIFVIGGRTKNERLSRSIYSIQLDTNGDIISIDTEKSLPITLAGMTSVVKDNEIYVIGGEINAGYTVGQQIELNPPPNNI